MIWFQSIVIPVLLALALRSVWRLARGQRPRSLWVLSAAFWACGAIAVWRPDLTSRTAALLGIGRGADLVLYVQVLAFVAVCFVLIRRWIEVQAQITDLVRHLAIQDARLRKANRNPEAPPTQIQDGRDG